MLRARSLRLRWIYLTFVMFAVAVVAQDKRAAEDDCDWYCVVENKIEFLEQQVDKIIKFLFSENKYNQPKPPTEPIDKPTSTLRSSKFGSPSTSTPHPQSSSKTASHAIISVSSVPQQTSTPSSPEADVEVRPGYRSLAYFGNWDIYARKFFPQQIPASQLTHLLYAFADNREDGTVFLTDPYADTEIHYAGDSWNEAGKNVYGAMKQLQLLKAANRNLKVLLSIGGWTYTNEKKHFDVPAATEQGRRRFADSCVELVRDYGFDGIDVDWEYPQDTAQGGQLLALLREIRSRLDDYAETLVYGDDYGNEEKPKFLLSIAAPAGEKNYRNMPLKEISDVLDFINLMAYDYAGSWDKSSGHSANLKPSLSNPSSTPFNTFSVVTAYLAAGVPASKLILGMPLYGRAFTNTEGLGKPYEGIGAGTWEKGVYDFKDLPLSGAKEHYDEEAGATYSYNGETGMLVSYDNVDMAMRKVEYIKQNKLGGAMWWEVSGDKKGDESIISNVVKGLGGRGGKGIESSPNWLAYPDSQFDNIKNGFAG